MGSAVHIAAFGGGVHPAGLSLTGSKFAGWFFTVWASVWVVLLVPWCVKRALSGDVIPLLVAVGGAIASVAEPMADSLVHLWWSRAAPGPAFVGFARRVPYFIPPAYVAGYALFGYFAYLRLARRPSVKEVFLLWGLGMIVFAVFEQPGVVPRVYEYAGRQPMEVYKYPLYNAWLNSTAILCIGFALVKLVPVLRSYGRAAVIFIPVSGMLFSWSVVAWPVYMALNWRMASALMWLLAGLSLLLAILTVRGIAEFVRMPEAPMAAEPGDTRQADESKRDVTLVR